MCWISFAVIEKLAISTFQYPFVAMLKKYILALVCLFAVVTSWETADCEEREMKSAIAVSFVISSF